MMHKFQLRLISCLPMGITVFLALLYVVPKHVGGLSAVMPLVHLVPVFIWSVMHPRDMRLVFVVAIGLLVDVATSQPLGVSGLVYAMFLFLARSQRKYIHREGFAGMWGYFALLLLVLQVMLWALSSFFHMRGMPLGAALWQWAFSVFLYPLLHALCYPWVERLARMRYRLMHRS